MIIPLILSAISGSLWLYGQNSAETAPLLTLVKGTTLSAKMQNIYIQYKQALIDGAESIGIPVSTAAAIMATESSGKGFGKDGRMIIRFEPAKFKHYSNGSSVPYSHVNQSKEYQSFNAAKEIDENAAYLSISMGLAQIMGFNYKTLGYSSPKAMFNDFHSSVDKQILGMFKFIGHSQKLVNAAKDNDFATFAHGYNGPGYKANNYDVKIANAKAALENSGILA